MRALLILIVLWTVGVTAVFAAEFATQHAAGVTIRQIDGPIDHTHCTTRQFQHMSFHEQGVWFVFYSDGKQFRYQTCRDSGITWQRGNEPVAPAPNVSPATARSKSSCASRSVTEKASAT